MKNTRNNKSGFTLLELLVVVLIIGILAAIALPQYKMAVTKAKVASILPIMRRWKDAMQEYKLQHDSYEGDAVVDANWPSDWNNCEIDSNICESDYWSECNANLDNGRVYCWREIDNNNEFEIVMYQHDDSDYEELKGQLTCEAKGTEGNKICKALGGKILESVEGDLGGTVYKLN